MYVIYEIDKLAKILRPESRSATGENVSRSHLLGVM